MVNILPLWVNTNLSGSARKDLARARKDLASACKDLARACKDLARARKDLARARKNLAHLLVFRLVVMSDMVALSSLPFHRCFIHICQHLSLHLPLPRLPRISFLLLTPSHPLLTRLPLQSHITCATSTTTVSTAAYCRGCH